VCAVDTTYPQSPVPVDAPAETAFTVSASGSVVTDRTTGLVWQRQVVPNPCPGDVGDGGTFGCTWSDAQTLCSSLNALTVGGYVGGWRLPSAIELDSIMNFDDGTPTLDTAIFPGTPLASFWAATPYALDTTQAWSLSVATGQSAPQPTPTLSYVRCVNSGGVTPGPETCGARNGACCYGGACAGGLTCSPGGACVPDVNFTRWTLAPDAPPAGLDGGATEYTASGGAVIDGVTGLAWAPLSGSFTWTVAATQCASLDTGGVGGLTGGWRLPSVVELQSIVNFGVASGPMIDANIFPSVTAAPYWTSTLAAMNAGDAWSLSFADGQTTPVAETTAEDVICVNSN
jgi:hypothetical protein